jgi:anti-sigma regulatory factor (Ser/Thr protein kinase)
MGVLMDEVSAGRTRSASFEAASESVRRARELIRELYAEVPVPADTVDTAMLLVSEVVTNAIVHGSGRAVLDAYLGPSALRVGVADESPALPEVRHDEALLTESGRGMLLVEQLAARWGVEPTPAGGKRVWFELPNVV